VPFRRFILIDLFCATVVISFFFSLGYIFAYKIREWLQAIRQAEYALSGSLLAVIAVVGLYFYVRRRRARADALRDGAAGGELPNAAKEQTKSVA